MLLSVSQNEDGGILSAVPSGGVTSA